MPTPKISTTPKSLGSSNIFSLNLLEPITPKIQKTARVLCTVNAILPPSENELEINNIYPVVEARECKYLNILGVTKDTIFLLIVEFYRIVTQCWSLKRLARA